MEDKFVTLLRLSRFLENLKNLFVQKDGSKVLSDNNYTNEEKEKLAGISDSANHYVLPVASDTVLGGIKVGNNLIIEDGVLSATGGDSITSATDEDIDNLFKGE